MTIYNSMDPMSLVLTRHPKIFASLRRKLCPSSPGLFDDTLLNRFINVNLPPVLWTSLRDAYVDNMVNRKMMLYQQIFNLCFSEGQSMSTNFLL